MSVSKKLKKGMVVAVLVGGAEFKGKTYEIETVHKDGYLTLRGYKTVKKAVKPTAENTDNFKLVAVRIHHSNVAAYNAKTACKSKIGFKVEGGTKLRVYKNDASVIG